MNNNRPHEIRVGRVKATIWENARVGRTFFDTSFVRIYKDGDQWKSSGSFGKHDLPFVAKVADMAQSWIIQQSQATTEDENGSDEEE